MVRILAPSIRFALQDIKLSVSGSLLGFAWVIINPLLLVGVYLFLFQYVMKVKFVSELPIDYGVFLLSGIVMWVSFANSLSKAVGAIVDNRHIVKKVNISPAVFVLSSGLSAFLVNSLSFLLLLMVCLIKYKYESYLLLSVSLLINFLFLVAFSLGLSLMLASLNVYVRDVSHIVANILSFAFYFTPILYTLDKAPGFIREFLKFNPMTYFAQSMHSAVMYGTLSPNDFYAMLGLSISVFIAGFLVYKYLKAGFYDVL